MTGIIVGRVIAQLIVREITIGVARDGYRLAKRGVTNLINMR